MMPAWLISFVAMMRAVVYAMAARIGVLGSVVFLVAALVTDDIVALWKRVEKDVFGSFADAVQEKAGLTLDRESPFSDYSMSSALSAKSGIEITTVRDSAVLTRDLSRHVSGLVAQQTGVVLTDVLSAEQVKADVVSHAHGVVTQQTGLDLVGAQTLDDVKSRITKHVETRIVNLVVKHIERAAAEYANPEASVDELLSMVYRGSEAKSLSASGVALGVAAGIVVAAYSSMSAPIKRKAMAFRRRAQNREAQRRFRQRHGNRMRYNKLTPPASGGGTGGATGGG